MKIKCQTCGGCIVLEVGKDLGNCPECFEPIVPLIRRPYQTRDGLLWATRKEAIKHASALEDKLHPCPKCGYLGGTVPCSLCDGWGYTEHKMVEVFKKVFTGEFKRERTINEGLSKSS